MTKAKFIFYIGIAFFGCVKLYAQKNRKQQDSIVSVYKKRVLESVEIDLLGSLYNQKGNNAAVSGGRGSELLENITGTIVIAIPLSADDVLAINAGISSYTSASSSNVNPFDGEMPASPFVASSGESRKDILTRGTLEYIHSSNNRNTIFGANASFSTEFDYKSFGFGANFAQSFNKKNTELNVKVSLFFDNWKLIYPRELRPDFNASSRGILNYNPLFQPFQNGERNSYNLAVGFSQILSKRLQGSINVDMTLQAGLLSTPFQRVYFIDFSKSLIDNFHLADDVERLPNIRQKMAIGGRLHFYINELISMRTFYRYYIDNWLMQSHTANIEVPIKILQGRIVFYPSYRFYYQVASTYFAPYNEHLSTSQFYTSDYDLSNYVANQFGLGLSYVDVLGKLSMRKFGFHSVDLKYYYYFRSTFSFNLLTFGIKLKIG